MYHKIQMHFSQGTKEFRANPMQKVLEPIQRVRFTKSTLRHASIREKKGTSLRKIDVKVLHQRSSYAVKFEDRSHEEIERQQRCARGKAWNFVYIYIYIYTSSKKRTKLHSTHPRNNGYYRLHQQKSLSQESLWLIPD